MILESDRIWTLVQRKVETATHSTFFTLLDARTLKYERLAFQSSGKYVMRGTLPFQRL